MCSYCHREFLNLHKKKVTAHTRVMFMSSYYIHVLGNGGEKGGSLKIVSTVGNLRIKRVYNLFFNYSQQNNSNQKHRIFYNIS